jgi:F0F1-type ATP synthase epsilon subunit
MEKLKVTVRNKTEVFIDNECLSVSMTNEIGPFDILPEHAHFISTIFGEVTVGLVGKKQWKKGFKRGVARVLDGVVEVVILED